MRQDEVVIADRPDQKNYVWEARRQNFFGVGGEAMWGILHFSNRDKNTENFRLPDKSTD
jgi:hypothetical protein